MDASAIPSSQANDEHTTKKRKLDEGEKQIEDTYTIHGNHLDEGGKLMDDTYTGNDGIIWHLNI